MEFGFFLCFFFLCFLLNLFLNAPHAQAVSTAQQEARYATSHYQAHANSCQQPINCMLLHAGFLYEPSISRAKSRLKRNAKVLCMFFVLLRPPLLIVFTGLLPQVLHHVTQCTIDAGC
jgi:hypothetical protein